MPSHAQSPTTTLDEKYAAAHLAAINHIKSSRSRKSSKKHSHDSKPTTTSSPQYDDFVLFPNSNANASESTRQQSPTKERRRNEQKGTPSTTHLAAATTSDRPSTPKVDSSRRNRTPRHGGFKVVNLLEESESNGSAKVRGGEGKTPSLPPPAPEPPTLDSPDISDVDDDAFWGDGGGEEGKQGGKKAA